MQAGVMAHSVRRPRGLVFVAGTALALGLAVQSGWGALQPEAPSGPPSTPPASTPGPEGSFNNPLLEPFEGRMVRAVELRGLKNTSEQLVLNQVRSISGRPLSQRTVQEDVQRCTRLGRFRSINAFVQPYDDQTVLLVLEFVETPIIKDVQVVGNRQISDQNLKSVVSLLANTPVDKFQLDRTLRQIEELYRKKGYYQAQVTIDQKELDDNGIVLFKIREGERLKVTSINFEGNKALASRELHPNIKTEEAWLLVAGTLDDNVLDQDVAALIKFYKDRGYLDVRADRQVRPAPNGREAAVTFILDEGPLYTLRSVRVSLDQLADEAAGQKGGKPGGTGQALTVFSQEQIAALLPIKPGDVYSIEKVGRAVDSIRNAYGKLGYIDATVARAEVRDPASPLVDLLLVVTEGTPAKTGAVIIRGNDLTQDKVIRRQVGLRPDRPLDTTEIRLTEQRLAELDLFAGPREGQPPPRITVQPPDPANPGYRDVLVEVEEKNTGSLAFGAAVSSDSGLIGQISLTQRNFDLYDTPDSTGELISGRAFRGAGQTFNIAAQPGTETQTYAISLSEPYFLETPLSIGTSLSYRTRDFDEYDERRIGGNLSVGRRFGERWSGSAGLRIEGIEISNLDQFSPIDIVASSGNNTLTGVSARLTRTTVDSRFRPSKGTRVDLGVERVGALGGDYNFTKLSAEHQIFLTVNEDYLGRKTVLSFKTFANYIPESASDVPVFERFYLGGRSFRGFAFRGVSPRSVFRNPAPPPAFLPSDRPVGGTWAFFFGPEIEQPIFQKLISVVAFVDSGTVTSEIGFEQYRVTAGLGLRMNIPQLGPAPLAFDFGFPIVSGENDRERVFSFSIDLPF